MLDFPSNPTVGQEFRSWFWDGAKWTVAGTGGNLSVGPYLPLQGGAMQGPITLVGNATQPMQPVTFQQMHVVSVLDYGAKGDGVTDDTVALQTTITRFAGAAVVLVPSTGSNYMTKSLTLPSFTDLLLYGTLQALPGLTGDYVVASKAVNVTIRGIGAIDGNKSAQTAAGAGLAIDQCGNVRVSGITLTNAYYWNLNVTQSNNIVFDGVTFLGGGAANEFAAQSDSCWLTNCILDGTNNPDYVFCFYGGVTNSGAIGNIMRNGGKGTTQTAPGIGVLSDVAQPLPCHNIAIANNLTYGNGGPGIQLLGYTQGMTTGIVVANNRSYNNNQIGAGGVAGADIFMDYVQDITVTGNQISGNGNPAGPYYTGIFIGNHCQGGFTITNNYIFNIGSGLGPATGGNNNSGLYAQNPTDAYIANNHFYDNQTTPSMAYSMTGGVLARCALIGNHLERPSNLNTSPDTVVANAGGGIFSFGLNTVVQSAAAQMITNSIGNARWFIGQDGSGETGGNAGSNFEIISVADNNTSEQLLFGLNRATGVLFSSGPITSNNGLGLWGHTYPTSKPVVTGAKNSNPALASFLTAMASYGFITDNSTA